MYSTSQLPFLVLLLVGLFRHRTRFRLNTVGISAPSPFPSLSRSLPTPHSLSLCRFHLRLFFSLSNTFVSLSHSLTTVGISLYRCHFRLNGGFGADFGGMHSASRLLLLFFIVAGLSGLFGLCRLRFILNGDFVASFRRKPLCFSSLSFSLSSSFTSVSSDCVAFTSDCMRRSRLSMECILLRKREERQSLLFFLLRLPATNPDLCHWA
jgi:hypothetical protein